MNFWNALNKKWCTSSQDPGPRFDTKNLDLLEKADFFYRIPTVVISSPWKNTILGEHFSKVLQLSTHFFIFAPKIGEDEPILTSIFFKWVVQPPTSDGMNTF